MTVRELNTSQLEELKTTYFYSHLDDDRSGQCGGYDCPWEVPDEVIFECYDGIDFVEEDFFCRKEEK